MTELETFEEPPAPTLKGPVELLLAAAVAGGLAYVLAAGRRAPVDPQSDPAYRGRGARSPKDLPAGAWRDILRRTVREFNTDHVSVIAAGVTFSVLLAIFPALAAFVALYGLVADVNDIPHQLATLSAVLPSSTIGFLGDQMTRLAQARHGGLSLALILGLLFSFWSANGAMKALFVGMNVAYEESEKRGLVKLNLTTLCFTFGLIVFFAVAVAALAADAVVARLVGPTAGSIVSFARWPALLLGFGGGITLLYRYGPSRERARWRWITPGSAAATALWLAASLLFSLYTSRFSHYDRTYGSLGAVVGLMIWIWISAIVVLLGAELNGEIEKESGVDTTTGPPLPPGRRGAAVADGMGPSAAAR